MILTLTIWVSSQAACFTIIYTLLVVPGQSIHRLNTPKGISLVALQ